MINPELHDAINESQTVTRIEKIQTKMKIRKKKKKSWSLFVPHCLSPEPNSSSINKIQMSCFAVLY